VQSVLYLAKLPGVKVFQHDGVHILNMGMLSADMNGVFHDGVLTGDLSELIEYAKTYFEQKNLPFYWWLGDEQASEETKSQLESHGLLPAMELPAMFADLTSFEMPALPKEITCRPVLTDKDLQDWIAVSGDAFTEDEKTYKEYVSLYGNFDYLDTREQELFLADYNDIPCATCLTFKSQEMAGLYYIATLHDYRRKGLGMAITYYAMQKAKEQGFHFAGLQASEMGYLLYASMGFKTLGKEVLYHLPGV
jgi:GNAT superfamily N-acetyltransferase